MSRKINHTKPRKRTLILPSDALEKGLDAFKKDRAKNLINGSPMGYYLKQASDDLGAFASYFAEASADHTAAPFKPWPQFDSPKKHLRNAAQTLGWRVIPFGMWAANKIGDATIARDIERDVRRWCAQADEVAGTVETLPKGRRYWSAHAALMRPLIVSLFDMLGRLRDHFSTYPDLLVLPPPTGDAI